MGKTALILAGGGSRGSYELGVWKALRELDVPIDIVTGTSIGAINGSLIAQGDYETAAAMWNKVETSHVFDVPVDEDQSISGKVFQTYRNFVVNFVTSGGTDTNPLRETLEEFFDEEKIRSSPIDYGLVTMEMDSRRPHELFREDIPEGRMIDYILASASIYPAVRPYVIDGVRYIDGTYHDNLPVKMALERGATSVIAVDLEAFGVVKKELLDLARDVKYIRCHWDLGPTLVFDHATIQRNIRLGYLDTMKAFGVYEGYAYTFEKGFAHRLEARLATDPLLSSLLLLDQQAEEENLGVMDRLLRGRIDRLLEGRGSPRPETGEFLRICAEIAGESFGLSSEEVYSEESWIQALGDAAAEVELPDEPDEEKRGNLLDSIKETASLLDRKVRAKYAAQTIRQCLVEGDFSRLITGTGILPDAFLAGVCLLTFGMA